MIKLDKCNGSCSTLSKISERSFAPNNIEKKKLNAFNLITRINTSRKLIKHISYKCKCKFDGKNVIHIKFEMAINFDARAKIEENIVWKNYV